MENTHIKIPKILLDKINSTESFDQSMLTIRIANDVYNTVHKLTTVLSSENCLQTYKSDKSNEVLDLNWDNLKDLDAYSFNVNLLELLLEGKVVHREFVVIGKDITLG